MGPDGRRALSKKQMLGTICRAVAITREAMIRWPRSLAIHEPACAYGMPAFAGTAPGKRGEGKRLFSQFLQLFFAGVAQGCVYALVALGFVLIYKATETVNFAQGDVMMLGAFFGLTASAVLGWPYWATILFAVVVMAVVGMLIERIVIRPVLGYPTFTVVMITIGVGYVLRGVVTMVPGWGTETYSLKTPFGDQVFRVAGAVIAADQLATIGLTAVLCLVLYLFFRFAKLGVAMQATSQNQLAAYYM